MKTSKPAKTTDRVRQLGLYASSCCIDEAVFDVNDQFSRCPKCKRLCDWDFVERVFSWQEFDEDFAAQAA